MSQKIPAVGSRAVVMHGNAKHTVGGLTKSDIIRKKRDSKVRYVSKEKSKQTAARYEDGSFRNDEWIQAIKQAAKENPGIAAPEIAKKAKPIYRRIKAGKD